MDFISDIIYKVLYYTFKVLTWGWVSYILLFFSIMLMIFALVYLLSKYKLIKYSAIEKGVFLKNYIYLRTQHNIRFVRFWIKEITSEYNNKKNLYIGMSIFIIAIIIMIILLKK